VEEWLTERRQAVAAARDSEQLTTNRYKEGTVSYLDVVITQTTALNNERTAVDVLGRRMVASVNLVQALGGGWDASGLPTGKDMRADVNVLGIGIPCSADGKSQDERAAAP
jgi:outer membrane protein TolC